MNKSRYVEYLLNQRKMKRTNKKDLVGELYSYKYEKWICGYLNKNKIQMVPLCLTCNTLYKLPDHFRLENDSFFVQDYYLFEYFYDWNYIYSEEKFGEYRINLCIKQYIESCVLNNKMDEAYWLCISSLGLEEYKDEKYFDESVMIDLTRKTDIQEAFTMIHEAGHYLIKFMDKDEVFKEIETMYIETTDILKTQKYDKFDFEIIDRKELEEDLFEECFCDIQAINYIMEQSELFLNIDIKDCYWLLFRTLLYIYILEYINIACQLDMKTSLNYYDYQLWCLTYRTSNLYNILYAKCLAQEEKCEIEQLQKIYTKYIDFLQMEMQDVRRIVFFIKENIEENADDMKRVAKIDEIDKKQFLKEFLQLIV